MSFLTQSAATSLFGSSLLHLFLGLALLAATLATGDGLLRLCLRSIIPADLTPAERFATAYIAGLSWTILAALLALVFRAPALFLLVVAAPVFAGTRIEGSLLPPARWIWTVILLASPALLFPLRAGFEYHGPTAVLAGQMLGDTTTYIAQIFGAQVQAFPIIDLRNDGMSFGFLSTAPALLGAILTYFPGVDPFHIFAVLFPTFGIAGVIIAIATLTTDRLSSIGTALLAGGLLSVAVQYMDWIVESPPVALSLPALPAFASLLAAVRPSLGRACVITVCGAVASLLGKIFLLPALLGSGFLAAASGDFKWKQRWLMGMAISAALIVGSVLFAYRHLFAVVFQPRFLPLEAMAAITTSVDYLSVQLLAYRLAELAIVISAFQRLPQLSRAFVVGGVLLFWLFPAFTLILRMAAFVLVASDIVRDRDNPRGRIAIGIAIATGFLGTSLFTGFPWTYGIPGWIQSFTAPRISYALAIAIGSGCALIAADLPTAKLMRWAIVTLALVALPIAEWTSTYSARSSAPFTPDLADIWKAVNAKTDHGTLIFTDQTGDGHGFLEGWNGYAAAGRRQIYISGWLNSRLMFDEPARNQRLKSNIEVLTGRSSPQQLAPGRTGYAAVVRAGTSVPSTFHLIHSNTSYGLYGIHDGARATFPK